MEKALGGEKRVRRLKHYSSDQKILIVGDGDFSFSLALAMAFGSGTNLLATSLDTYGLSVDYFRFHIVWRVVLPTNTDGARFSFSFLFCLLRFELNVMLVLAEEGFDVHLFEVKGCLNLF